MNEPQADEPLNGKVAQPGPERQVEGALSHLDHAAPLGSGPDEGEVAGPGPKSADASAGTLRTDPVMKSGPGLKLAAAILILLLGLGGFGVYSFLKNRGEAAATGAVAEVASGPLKVYAHGSLASLVTYDTPKSVNDIAISDKDHKPVHLSAYVGKVVVLNLWATWCTPCRTEMPTLSKLQLGYAGKPIKVMPLSVDKAEKFDEVRSFIGVQDGLDPYLGSMDDAIARFKVQGMPTTLILDKKGREVARLNGETNWDTPEVRALMDHLAAE